MLHFSFYIIMFAITLFSFIEFSSPYDIKKKLKSPYIFIVIILILFSGLRFDQGADFYPYYKLFLGSNSYVKWNDIFDTDLGVEPAYIAISKVVGNLQLPFFAVLLVHAVLSISLKGYSFYKFSPYPFFSLLYYFMPGYFFQDMSHIRQGLSIALCLFAFKFILEKKLLYFLLTVLLAYLSHKTAIVFLPAYWIANTFITTTQSFSLLVISFVLSPLEPYNWAGSFLESVSTDTVTDAFSSYKNLEELGFTVGDLVKLFFILLIFLNDKKMVLLPSEANYVKVRNLVVTFLCIYYLCRGNVIFAARLPVAYEAYLAILLAIIIKYNYDAFSRTVTYVLLIIYFYLLSIRFAPNARALSFDQFRVMPFYKVNLKDYIPNRVID